MSGAQDEVISVGELARRMRRAVEGTTGKAWVEGELSSLKRASSGHTYFTLKDEREDACVECVMYKFQASRARRVLAEGARLQVLGRATVWAPRGRLQFVVEVARQTGRGALLEALEQLKLRLAAEGLFAPERKRPLPHEPRIVGVVTSRVGAAFQDICTVAFRRGGVRIVLSPARVQGEGAAAMIVRAIALLERYPGLDVLIVGRGGGSGEDLMAFNDERVVRRLAETRVPVVSAVGHEIDFTLTDLVADVRAATPSQAAELVIADSRARRDALRRAALTLSRAARSRLLQNRASVERLRAALSDPRFIIAERQQQLDELLSRMERQETRALARRRAAFEELQRGLFSRNPRVVLLEARAELGPRTARLAAATRSRLGVARERLGQRSVRLQALSPLAVLSRGYAIATLADGRALRSSREVVAGDAVELTLHEGRVGASVTRVVPGEKDRA